MFLQWSQNHDGLSCEQYAAWLADNDPEISVAAVQQHLRENGLECPRCHFKYSLSRYVYSKPFKLVRIQVIHNTSMEISSARDD